MDDWTRQEHLGGWLRDQVFNGGGELGPVLNAPDYVTFDFTAPNGDQGTIRLELKS